MLRHFVVLNCTISNSVKGATKPLKATYYYCKLMIACTCLYFQTVHCFKYFSKEGSLHSLITFSQARKYLSNINKKLMTMGNGKFHNLLIDVLFIDSLNY